MKSYPSIQNSGGQSFEALGLVPVFDKLDGSNLRMEWTKKRGWYKFGSRTQMIDESSLQFGTAIPVMTAAGEEILATFKRKPQKLVVFGEWHGPNSFAGIHDADDKMRFSTFDVCVDNSGWLDPKQFARQFVDVIDTPAYLGEMNWSRGLIQDVRDGNVEGVTFEGIVGKLYDKPRLKMAKAKTQAWIDKVKALYPGNAQQLIES